MRTATGGNLIARDGLTDVPLRPLTREAVGRVQDGNGPGIGPDLCDPQLDGKP